MLAPVRFVERRRELEAIQVTADNIAQVAQWCGGHVIRDETGQPIAVGVPIGGSILRAAPDLYVTRRISADGHLHHQPLLERDLFACWEPAGP